MKVLTLLLVLSLSAQGSFKVRSDEFLQIGYDQYNTLSFGNATNGNWVVEHWNNGLNFSKPYPSTSYGNYKLFIKDDNGYVGIGKIPSYKLDVNGDIATYGTLRITSDERLKTNIVRYNNSVSVLGRLLDVNTYHYNYYSSYPYESMPTEGQVNVSEIKKLTTEGDAAIELRLEVEQKRRHGFIAQEVKVIFPDLVEEDQNGMLNIDYLSFIPVFIEAVKEQQEYIYIS